MNGERSERAVLLRYDEAARVAKEGAQV